MNTAGFEAIRSISASVEMVTARDLATLKGVEGTIDKLNEYRGVLRLHTAIIRREIGLLQNYPEVIDESGELIVRLEKVRTTVGLIHDELRSQCCTAETEPSLKCDEDLVLAYKEVIEAAAALHNAINDLCWAIGEHDADFDETLSGSFDSAEDLFRQMGV